MAARKKGLGKGLYSVIPDKKETAAKVDTQNEEKPVVVKEVVKEVVKDTSEVDINKIEPNEGQPRRNFDEEALQELAESIKEHGVIQPLIVKKAKKGFYTIIAGERRWRASKLAGLKTVPVIVKEYTDQQVMEVALIENIQREDLNAIEEAEAYSQLSEEFHLKQDEVAQRVSKSRVAITNSIRLLKLDEKVRTMVIEDKIKGGHARALLAITDGKLQYQVAMQVYDQKLSVRETEKLVKKLLTVPKPKKKKEVEDEQTMLAYKSFEEKLKTAMGTKVNVVHKGKGKGKIEIEYFSQDDFDRIVETMLRK